MNQVAMDLMVQNYWAHGTFIPGFAMKNQKLSPLAKLLLGKLYALDEEGRKRFFMLDLMQQLGASADDILNALMDELDAQKYIIVSNFNKKEASFECTFLSHESMRQVA